MKIAIASDHAGFALKQTIIEHFKDRDFDDCGTFSEESCDYPDFISQAAFKVRDAAAEAAIVICGSGIGASIVANKVNGIRCALCFNSYMAEMSRRHNNANALALGSRIIGEDIALRIVEIWLNTDFDGGRHQRRIEKITDLETC